MVKSSMVPRNARGGVWVPPIGGVFGRGPFCDEESGDGGQGGGAVTQTPPALNERTQSIIDALKPQFEALSNRVGAIEQQTKADKERLDKALQPRQSLGYDGPHRVRQGEDIMSSRGLQFFRALGTLSGAIEPEQAKIERELSGRLKKLYGSQNAEMGSGRSLMLPISADHIGGWDRELATECYQLSAAGMAHVTFGDFAEGTNGEIGSFYDDRGMTMNRYAQAVRQSNRVRQAANIFDDHALGAFVGDVMEGELIELVRPLQVLMAAGAREITMPASGRLAWPRQTGATKGYWVGMGQVGKRNRRLTEDEPTVGGLVLSCKKLGVMVRLPNDLFRFGSNALEAFIRTDIAEGIATTEQETMLFTGDPSNDLEPTALVHYAGIQEHIASTVGANGDTFELEDVDYMRGKVEEANLPTDNFRLIMRPMMFYKVRNRRADAITAGDGAGPFLAQDIASTIANAGVANTLRGSIVHRTTAAPKDRVKGSSTNLTQILGGDFRQVIIGRHGVVEFGNTDSHEDDFANDISAMRAISYVDMIPRRENAFVECDNLLIA